MGIIKARCCRDGAIQLGVIYHEKSEDRCADRMSLKGQREGLSLSQEEGYPPVVVEEKVGYVGTYVGRWVGGGESMRKFFSGSLDFLSEVTSKAI